jgi:hypothetical protein
LDKRIAKYSNTAEYRAEDSEVLDSRIEEFVTKGQQIIGQEDRRIFYSRTKYYPWSEGETFLIRTVLIFIIFFPILQAK